MDVHPCFKTCLSITLSERYALSVITHPQENLSASKVGTATAVPNVPVNGEPIISLIKILCVEKLLTDCVVWLFGSKLIPKTIGNRKRVCA